MAESEQELKSILMNMKEESEKVDLKLNIQKTMVMASGPITSWQIDGKTKETVTDFILLGSKITADGDCSHDIKWHLLLGRKAMTNLDSILKSRDPIALLTNTLPAPRICLPMCLLDKIPCGWPKPHSCSELISQFDRLPRNPKQTTTCTHDGPSLCLLSANYLPMWPLEACWVLPSDLWVINFSVSTYLWSDV